MIINVFLSQISRHLGTFPLFLVLLSSLALVLPCLHLHNKKLYLQVSGLLFHTVYLYYLPAQRLVLVEGLRFLGLFLDYKYVRLKLISLLLQHDLLKDLPHVCNL